MPDIVAGVIGIVFICVWLYCLYDVVTTSASHIRYLPKIVWFLIVLFLSGIGSIAWLCFGRPRSPSERSARHDRARTGTRGAPLPAADILDGMHPIAREREELARLRMKEAQRRRREEELYRRESGDP